MKLFKIAILLTASILYAAASSWACEFKNKVPVNSLSNAFEAFKVVTAASAECGNYKAELDIDFKNKQPAAMAANPSQYTIGGISNSTIVPLLDGNLIRPLDQLVAKYGSSLTESQKIRIDGKIMAIAMMVNAQHWFFRTDVLGKLGIEVPTTYKEVLEAAKKIKKAGIVDYPLGATFKAGWNLGEEFINMYLGTGGMLVDAKNKPAFNNAKGVATLEMMKKLTRYMDPEYLLSDSTYVQKQFQQGKIAMANLWASRAGNIDDPKESKVIGLIDYAAAPAFKAGGAPATTLWWDGFTIARNIPDKEAEAGFRVMMAGIDHKVLAANPDAAIWLSSKPIESRMAKGAVASAQGGAPSYPASAVTSIVHTQAGQKIVDYLTGKKSAKTALADMEAAYLVTAKESGYVK